MSTVSEFPVFIRAAYAEGDAFTRFQQEVANTTRNAEKQFGELGDQMRRVLDRAVTAPRGAGGALNLGVAEAQAAARAADQRAAAAMEVANAVRLAAAAEGDYSQNARLSTAAAEALANDERQAAKAARDHAAALAQVQAVLDRNSKAVANSTNVVRLNTTSAGAQRAAYVQLGQQLQDATIQAQMGTSALTILTQQGSQAAFALSGLGGVVGRVATFFAGPWGAAVFAATALTGGLTAALWSNKSALDGVTGSASANKSATEALTIATAALDEITGRLKESTDDRRVATGLATAATIRDTQAALAAADAMLVYREAQLSAQRARAGNNFSNSAMAGLFGITAQVDAERQSVDAMRKSLDEARKSLQFAMQPTSFAKFNERRFAGGASAPKAASSAAGGGGAVDKEAKAAERAVQELESKIQQLEARFDPATTAAREFAAALEAINQASARGMITQGRAQDLSTAAIFAEGDRVNAANSAAIAKFMQTYTLVDLDAVAETAEAYSRRIASEWEAAQGKAASAFGESLANVDIFRQLLSGRGLGSIVSNPDPARMATGSDSFIGSLLYGKKTLEDGQSRVGLVSAYQESLRVFERGLDEVLKEVFGKDASKLGEVIGGVLVSAQVGSQFAGITGGNRAAGAVGGVLGSELGKTLASGPLGKALGSLSSALGPLGGIVGGIALGALGSALTPAKRGSVTIGGSGGNLAIASTRGNSKSRIAQSSDSAGEAITTLERIAEALGGTIDASRGSVSIGVRDKNFRVDTSGSGITKTKKGAIDFGQDSAAAIKFATMDLIKDGVITGLRASTQRILQNSKDLDDALRRATDFQSVFDRLQARIDPVGAAISGVDREFSRLRDIFGQAQASAAEYADLEKLFQMERTDAIKEANDRVLGSMRSLLDDLRFGDNGRSLRDRMAAAQANFDPLSARVQAGDLTAYDDFAEAARTLLDIQRQFSGSQTAFFTLQDQITAITARAVEGGNVTSILAGGSAASAQAEAQRSFESAPIVNAIGQQTTDLINGIVSGLGRELRNVRDAVASGGGGLNVPGMFVQNVRQI